MALNIIKKVMAKRVKDMIQAEQKNIGLLSGLGDKIFFDLELSGDAFFRGEKSIIDGVEKIYANESKRIQDQVSVYNTQSIWRGVISQLNNQIMTIGRPPGFSIQIEKFDGRKKVRGGAFWLQGSTPDKLVIRFIRNAPGSGPQKMGSAAMTNKISATVATNTVQKFAKEYRIALYDMWFIANSTPLFGPTPKSRIAARTRKKYVTQRITEVAHEEQTTTSLLALDKYRNLDPGGNIGFGITPTNLMAELLSPDGYDINFDENHKNYDLKRGNKTVYTADYRIEARLGYNKAGSEITDLANEQLTAQIQRAVDAILRRRIGNVAVDILNTVGSKSIKQNAADDAALLIVEELSKGKLLKKKKVSVKRSKPKNRTGISAQKRKRFTKKKSNLTISAPLAVAVARRRQTGKKVEDKGLSVARLKYLINRSLPAEVRRNMGRPALINRTGQFSNSAELVNLRQGPKTLIGEYTYQKDPYQTFENLGTKQWPQGYNPKPLIAKSIRNLAERHVAERFTLRRI